MFKNKSLNSKLLFAFGTTSIFIMIVATIGYFSMKKVQSDYSYISDVILMKVLRLGEQSEAGHEAHRLVLRAYASYSGEDATGLSVTMAEFGKYVEKRKALDLEYKTIPFIPGGGDLYLSIQDHWIKYTAVIDKLFVLMRSGGTEAEIKNIVEVELRNLRLESGKKFDDLFAFQSEYANSKKLAANQAYRTANILALIVSVSGIVFATTIGFYFANTISSSMALISENILGSATQTETASQQLTEASSQLSQGATESAASLEETVSSLEELSSMVKLNSAHALQAKSLSHQSLNSAETGEKNINRLIEAMNEMSKSSKKIEEIINVIDDIAFQTNLLALNAAVEAARAGEQGKGFAVVADAVRNLAGRSAVAAKDINALIKENVGKSQEGVEIADVSGVSLKEILEAAKKVADLNSEIAAASQEQANGLEQISKAMNQLDQAIQENASSSEEVASSATEMSSQAETLSELVQNMKQFIDGKTMNGDHGQVLSFRPNSKRMAA